MSREKKDAFLLKLWVSVMLVLPFRIIRLDSYRPELAENSTMYFRRFSR